jgi:hypothetical protein
MEQSPDPVDQDRHILRLRDQSGYTCGQNFLLREHDAVVAEYDHWHHAHQCFQSTGGLDAV